LTDLALLKIDETELSFIRFGESDNIEVGEWVVAVGNPFNLASTVTVGIVEYQSTKYKHLKSRGAQNHLYKRMPL
jgi:S1-C subfamily serine protease